MVVSLVFFFVLPVVILPAQQRNPGGGVDGFFFIDHAFEKILQSGAGDDNGFRRLGGLYLADIQGVVVEAGNRLRNQPGHGQAGTLAEPLGKFRHRQRGGGNIGVGPGCAPGQGQQQRGA